MSSQEQYTLFYWPAIPGRGEFVRLAFEHARVAYNEVNDVAELQKLLSNKSVDGIAAPHFAVPVLAVNAAGGGTKHYISQTPAQLHFLAPRLGLLGDAEELSGLDKDVAVSQILQLTLTALDLNNETHDTHHPISVSAYYEEQIDEAKKRAEDYKKNRLPKFLGLFEVALSESGAGADQKNADSRRLYGSKTTVADLTLFQVVDGLLFAFPKYLDRLKKSGKYDNVFQLHQDIKNELKAYLDSDRRKPYSNGVFRYYPELDDQ